jgi:predicted N-acyltransferase
MRTNISTSITDIDPAAWDALDAGGSPFLRHAFLARSRERAASVPEQLATGAGHLA